MLSLVKVHLSGHFVPPWQVNGLTVGGGIRPIERFETLSQAQAFAEDRFPARGAWQPEPANPQSGSYLTNLLPGHIDWRAENLGEAFQGATLTWTRFSAETHGDHEHCSGCWSKFMDTENDPDLLSSGFVRVEGDWLCEGCYHDLKEYLRLRTALP